MIQLAVWPNPATHGLFLEWNDAFETHGFVRILFTDIVGRVVFEDRIPDQGGASVEVELLPPGIYNATVQKESRMGTVRFIKF